MRKSSISGWKDVFSFTLIQTLKNRAFIISYIILLLLAAVSMPILNMVTSGSEEDPNAPSPVYKVYINNQTSLTGTDFAKYLEEHLLRSQQPEDQAYTEIAFVTMAEDVQTVTDRIETKETDSVLLTMNENDGMYSLDFQKAGKGPVKDNNLAALANVLLSKFTDYKLSTLGITKEQESMLEAPISSEVSLTDTNGDVIVKEDTSISFSEYWFIYGILFVVMMVNIMASTQIANSIVTEKSTRVIEYLLMSVKPLAIMVGKIIAMLTAVLLQMISIVAFLFISNGITARLSSGSGETVLSQYLPSNIFENLNFLNIIICFLVIILGMIFYAALAGLAGATVSKIEELREGLTLFTIVNLIGVYVGLGAAGTLMGSGVNAYVVFTFLFPLSSPFLLPGAILIGKVSLPILAASILLQIVFIVLLFLFVARVYETLILHTGNKIKMKDLFKISKTA